jgi:hypothetical protein
MKNTFEHIIDAPIKFDLGKGGALVVEMLEDRQSWQPREEFRHVFRLTPTSCKALLHSLPRLQKLLESQVEATSKPVPLR